MMSYWIDRLRHFVPWSVHRGGVLGHWVLALLVAWSVRQNNRKPWRLVGSKNHTAHNQSRKAHRNGLRK